MVDEIEGKSLNFRRFIKSFSITDSATLEDYDIDSLFKINESEREEAEELLIKRLVETNDYRAPRALAYIKCRRAIPQLEKAIKSKQNRMLVETAVTLKYFTGDESVLEVLIKVLKDGDVNARIAAASYLKEFSGVNVDNALISALYDDNNIVRNNALSSLLTIYDLKKWDLISGQGLGLFSFQLFRKYKAIRSKAVESLTEVIAMRREGKSPEEIGLPSVSRRRTENAEMFLFSSCLFPGQAPWEDSYDLEALTKIEGEEVKWVECTIIANLEDGDFRAVSALVHINSEIAPDVFREAIPSAEGRLLVELVWGLWKLTGDKSRRELLRPYLDSEDERVKVRANEVFTELS